MSDNLSFLLTCAAECLNNWGYDGHGKHVDDGVKEITRLRAENEKLRNSYNQAIDDAADLLNCVDLPRDELAAAIRKLKK